MPGPALHVQYLREQLPSLVRGEYVDAYSSAWQTIGSLARRMFQAEPELNPYPVLDAPALARSLGAGLAHSSCCSRPSPRPKGRAAPRVPGRR